ncbi:MAG: ankyrin repeat domain-containing protein [Candidatus Micrarchaeia archaeon]
MHKTIQSPHPAHERNFGEVDILSERLMDAVASNNLKKVKNLIKKGADPNFRDERGFTPLFYAVIKGNYDIAEFLISQNADVNVKAKYEGDLMMYAVFTGNVNLVRLLKQSGCTEMNAALELALKLMKYDIVETLTE